MTASVDHPARLVAGVDLSTQATKVLIVDATDGRVVASGRSEHQVTGTDGARETDPRAWWTALRDALAATGRAGDVAAISVAGQQHGLVTLDGQGMPLRDAMLWNDTRSAPDAARIVKDVGADVWASRTGSRPVASFTVTKWAWLRRSEPDVASRVRAIRLPHDYVTERLTGRGVTDRGDASGTGWWSPGDEDYARDILGLPSVALDEGLLPTILGPSDAAGEVDSAVAAELGLRADVVVGPGTGDNMGAALGLRLGVGQPVLSLGTSGTAFTVAERRSADASGVVAGFADATGRFLPLACTLNCTLAVDRIAEWLRLDRDDVQPTDGVVVLPWLDGERTPDLPGAAGTIAGLRHSTTPRQVLMAAYEGAIASLLEGLDRISGSAGAAGQSAPLILIGGGARGRTWQDVVRRLSGRALLIPRTDELVALGAALQAAAVVARESVEAVAARWGSIEGTLVDGTAKDADRLDAIRAVRDAVESAAVFSDRRS